ncbi:hypothetical protein HYW94_03885 [Candidatus Uhrbacteria bacterium]|nr:hypothetical protein [Candidatus Uhrbacteria bacterium]
MKNKGLLIKKGKARLRESAGERFSRIASMNEQIFHASDLAHIWNIHNPSTLHMTLARYASGGLIHRIQKGLYAIKKPTDLNPYLLGIKALHGPAYISCETVLFDNGIINQPPRFISMVSGTSRRFSLLGNEYHSRTLSDAFLFNDAGIEIHNGVRTASVPRAVADTLYFNPKKHLDVLPLIQWSAVRNIIRVIGYPTHILKNYADAT